MFRVERGGGWDLTDAHCRAFYRGALRQSTAYGYNGLRVARVPAGKEIVKVIASEEKKPPVESKLPPPFKNGLGMEFVLVPKGKSWLGGSGGKPGDKEVQILHDFYLGKYEVTQGEWEKVTGKNPSYFSRNGGGKLFVKAVSDVDLNRFPVDWVSWEDAQEFVKRLNEQDKSAGWVYRLPKEAEWEYACRGGPLDKVDGGFDYYLDTPANKLLPEQANVGNKQTCKVGSYRPNRLGLHDMHGNVLEWCEELFDLKEPKSASFYVLRGGSYNLNETQCRASYRNTTQANQAKSYIGLRVARVPIGKEIAKVIAIEEKKK